MAGLGVGNGVLRFVKQRLQGFMTVPLPDTSAYLGLSECIMQTLCHTTLRQLPSAPHGLAVRLVGM